MYDSILVATDGSDGASLAVDHAIELAAKLGASLETIAVIEQRTDYDNAIVDPDEVDRTLRDRAAAALDAVEAEATAAGISVETTIRSGVPHEEIVACAADSDVDAIVVGAQGGSGLRRALLGSPVDGVVRLADRPVLVVGQ